MTNPQIACHNKYFLENLSTFVLGTSPEHADEKVQSIYFNVRLVVHHDAFRLHQPLLVQLTCTGFRQCILFIGLDKHLPYLKDMTLLNEPHGRIDLLGHGSNGKAQIALEVIPNLPYLHGVACLSFSSTARACLDDCQSTF